MNHTLAAKFADQREPWIYPDYRKPRHGYQFRRGITAYEKRDRLLKLCSLEPTQYVIVTFKSKPKLGINLKKT